MALGVLSQWDPYELGFNLYLLHEHSSLSLSFVLLVLVDTKSLEELLRRVTREVVQ